MAMPTTSSPPPLAKKEEFKILPRSFKQSQFQLNHKSLRTATAFTELPRVLFPSNDRRAPFPPLVNYGYALTIEQLEGLLVQKLSCQPGVLLGNPFGVLVHLQQTLQYGLKFQAVYLDGTETFFLAISSNWEPAPAERLKEVVQRLKDFLEVKEEPVWCLDVENCF